MPGGSDPQSLAERQRVAERRDVPTADTVRGSFVPHRPDGRWENQVSIVCARPNRDRRRAVPVAAEAHADVPERGRTEVHVHVVADITRRRAPRARDCRSQARPTRRRCCSRTSRCITRRSNRSTAPLEELLGRGRRARGIMMTEEDAGGAGRGFRERRQIDAEIRRDRARVRTAIGVGRVDIGEQRIRANAATGALRLPTNRLTRTMVMPRLVRRSASDQASGDRACCAPWPCWCHSGTCRMAKLSRPTPAPRGMSGSRC